MDSKPAWAPDEREIEFILNSTHDAMIAVNEHGIINILNTAAQRILDVYPEEMLGRRAIEVIPGSRLHIVLSTGEPELNQQQQIGALRVLTNRVPVRDKEDRVVGAVAVFRDITEIQQLAEEITNITAMKVMLEAIIDATQDVISVTDQNGKLILVNQAYTRLMGLSKEDVVGKPATIDIREGESMHLYVMKTLEPVRGIPLQVGLQAKDVMVNAAPIIVQGQLRGSVAVAHDVSEIRRLTEELGRMKSLVRQIQSRYTFDDIVAKSPSMFKAVELARRAAATPVTVLLSGESGTGKELFAHSIHHASGRKNAPLVRVNCAAIPESLLESELFGYENGAFTGARKGGKKGLFEEANGGTIFLDEIGEVPLTVQVKLLRVLQEKEILRVGGAASIPINIRVIAATNRNLALAVEKGSFREDLFYRISVFPIPIPPLRDRLDELPDLTIFLLRKLNEEYGRNVQQVASDALSILRSYRWPGNVRELENILARGMINMLFNETIMRAVHLPPLTGTAAVQPDLLSPDPAASLPRLAPALNETERQSILTALTASSGNKPAAASLLGISIRSLYYKLKKYNIGTITKA